MNFAKDKPKTENRQRVSMKRQQNFYILFNMEIIVQQYYLIKSSRVSPETFVYKAKSAYIASSATCTSSMQYTVCMADLPSGVSIKSMNARWITRRISSGSEVAIEI